MAPQPPSSKDRNLFQEVSPQPMTSFWLNIMSGPQKTLGKEPSESKEAGLEKP